MTSLTRVRQSEFNLWDGLWRLTMWYSSKKSFIKPIPSRPHTHRGIQKRTKPRKVNHSLLHPHFASLTHTDALVYHFIPKRLYTLKQTEETVIVQAQLSCTVHLFDCWGTKGPLLMRLAACEWEVRHPWPFPWLWTFNLPSTHPYGSDNTKQTLEREREWEKKPDTNGFSIVCKSPLIWLLAVLRDWSRAVGKNKLHNRDTRLPVFCST